MSKRSFLVIGIIALLGILFFEVTWVVLLISEKGQVTSSERSSQSFNQSEQSTNKSKSTETASVNESTQESVKPAQSQSTNQNQHKKYRSCPRSDCQKYCHQF